MSLTLLYGTINLVSSYLGTSLVHCLQDRLFKCWSLYDRCAYSPRLWIFGTLASETKSVGFVWCSHGEAPGPVLMWGSALGP